MNQLRRANEYFGISKSDFEKSGAFNPVIGVDNLFFVDPLLLSKTTTPELKDGLVKVRKYFSEVITLLGFDDPKTDRKAWGKLILREVKGVGIGYGNKSDDGSAIGPQLAKRLVDTAKYLIQMGIKDPAIFEVMGLFEEDFGPDRLSDALIRILHKDLCRYTERVANELSIKDRITLRQYERSYSVPRHPFGKKPLLFIPADILRNLPLANNFEEICQMAAFNEELRGKFNDLIAVCFTGEKKKPSKSDIRGFLLGDKDRIHTIVQVYRSSAPNPYNFVTDPSGIDSWLEKARYFTKLNPIDLPAHPQEKDLEAIVQKIISAFKSFIETKGGWRSLYDDKLSILNESHAQHFFYATAMIYCELCDIDISPESNAGRGPVDFKLSKGSKEKIIVEIKLTSGAVLHGYKKQTRIYQECEEAKKSFYVVAQVTDKSKALDRILEMAEEEDDAGIQHPIIISIDGRKKPPASKG